ncbi:hypothetical protein J4411_02255 [Candidatus Pacearchaeota archaeon]|nr:hypothetical protein [Candidatus Pacearchaeota archaeon]
MEKENLLEKNLEEEKMGYDEESLGEKIKNRGSLAGIIGLGTLGFVHTLSHVIPAIGALGMSQLETNHNEAIYVLGYNIEPIITHPVMQIAYLAFVPLSFWYIYKDHKHHKHEKEVRNKFEKTKKELLETKSELESLKRNYTN